MSTPKLSRPTPIRLEPAAAPSPPRARLVDLALQRPTPDVFMKIHPTETLPGETLVRLLYFLEQPWPGLQRWDLPDARLEELSGVSQLLMHLALSEEAADTETLEAVQTLTELHRARWAAALVPLADIADRYTVTWPGAGEAGR